MKKSCNQKVISCPCLGAVEVVQDKGFHLDLEDYLAGVLIMANELVRMFYFIFFFLNSIKVI